MLDYTFLDALLSFVAIKIVEYLWQFFIRGNLQNITKIKAISNYFSGTIDLRLNSPLSPDGDPYILRARINSEFTDLSLLTESLV